MIPRLGPVCTGVRELLVHKTKTQTGWDSTGTYFIVLIKCEARVPPGTLGTIHKSENT